MKLIPYSMDGNNNFPSESDFYALRITGSLLAYVSSPNINNCKSYELDVIISIVLIWRYSLFKVHSSSP